MNKKVNPIFVIFTIIILILSFYQFNEIDNGNGKNMCNKKLYNSFARQFYHGDISHLLSNLFVFFQLSYLLDKILDLESYLLLIVSLIVLLSLIDYVLYKNNLINCSIGFSGVVFGLYAWVLLYNKGFNKALFIDLIVLLYPSLVVPNISFIGHLTGIIVGIFMYKIFDTLNLY
jgi:membrane associated rhomboid family serine protease